MTLTYNRDARRTLAAQFSNKLQASIHAGELNRMRSSPLDDLAAVRFTPKLGWHVVMLRAHLA